MKTLLRLDTSARSHGSYSRRLADHFQRHWQHRHADGRVLVRDLAANPPPHLTGAMIAAFHGAPADGVLTLSDQLVDELLSADTLLIGAPIYNLTLPSPLKAWLDHVVRPGRTVAFSSAGRRGLLAGRSAYLVTTRGGFALPGPAEEYQTPCLRAVLRYLGFTRIESLCLEGTVDQGASFDARWQAACAQIEAWWPGPLPAGATPT